jgi:peptidoglycan hydrolase CwlO-like protein
LTAQQKNLQHEVDTMRDQVEEEVMSKNEVLRQVNKTNAEVQQWRAKFESEGETVYGFSSKFIYYCRINELRGS